ncbi:hypothetical protein AB0D99_00835 [Streptomyces sp. NPDC047971]|uniref:hypothetical protein n=1 Tax=Streptomyces sp. NPDC047971 TaxID=3154499 RepID=UPI0033F843BA
MTGTSRYHLRYQLLPGRDPRELGEFCVAHGVDEVVLIYGSEELHTGHPAAADEDFWFEHVAHAHEVLTEFGVSLALNPWVTTGHADRGRVQDLGFAPMVSPRGEVATATASFACPVWRDWLASHYGRFARLGFRVLWIEDDFRFHNHAPLTWGGGFEPGMLDRFAESAGIRPSREQLVEAVTGAGVHPWREILRRTWRRTQEEALDAVREAVGGRARLGIMSSGLGSASLEGRDWDALFTRCDVHRPHFAPYSDQPGAHLSHSVAMLELQRPLRPDTVEVAPEIENWSHTEWSKSDTQTWSEMVTAQLSGADALLLDLFPFVTGDPARYPRIGRLLDSSRPALDATVTDALTTIGVGVPWWPETAASIPGDGTLRGLEADPVRTARFLLSYGIPVQAGAAPVTALFGNAAWGVPDEELPRLLAGGLLLDGVAARVLGERGYGEFLGVRVDEIVERDTPRPDPYSMERVLDEDALLSVNVQPALARMTAAPGARAWTHILTPRGEHCGDGRVAHTNRLGGRVMTLAACAPDALGRCDDGQRLAQRMVRFLGAELPLVTGGPHLIPQYGDVGGARRLAIANGSADPARPVVTTDVDPTALLLEPLKDPVPVPVRRVGPRVHVEADVPHRGYVILRWP